MKLIRKTKNKNFLSYAIKILRKPLNTKFEIDGKQVSRIKYIISAKQ